MKCAILHGVLLVLISLNTFCSCEDSPTVKISDGELKGSFLKSRNSRTYAAFLGIPFAKPPQRFKNAEFPEPWKGIRDATKFGEQCVQKEFLMGTGEIIGSEDCLFLNVYSNKLDGRLPVMVFIHGGGFVNGGSNLYGAGYFMDEDVVLVTINYRLGALGFLSTGDGEAEANLGLKDQNLALKWVQKNIASFGGDPEQVTIFGESAGSGSVHYQVLSPLSKGLFKHAILQSGTVLNPWTFTDNPKQLAIALGNSFGCNVKSSKSLLECLSQKKAEDLMSESFEEWFKDPIVTFPPTIDPPGSDKIFLPESPKKMLKSGKFNKVPMIFTVCEDEGILLHAASVVRNEKLTKEINEEYLRVLPITLMYNKQGLSANQQNLMSNEIKNFYFGNKDIGLETEKNLTNLYSDRYFIHGVEKSVSLHSKHSTVYNGIISHKGELSIVNFFGVQENLGVAHGDDIMYLFSFDGGFMPSHKPDSPDEKFSKLMIKMWTTFAATGNPGSSWKSFSKSSGQSPAWWDIDLSPQMLQDPFRERNQFWNNLLEKVKSLSTKEEL